jgi:peptidoglycan hydrolase-like protein with peptidoglycan-binding domain
VCRKSTAGRVAAVLSLLLVAVAGTAVAAEGKVQPRITGGAPDGSAHPYVSMVLPPGRDRPNCTGVLVRADNGAPVVLTDAHCLYTGQHTGDGVRVTFASDFSSTVRLVGGRFSIDPRYDRSTHLHDVAVITLASAAGVTPARLAPLHQVHRIRIGRLVDSVGTGTPYSGHRRVATERVTRRATDWLYLVPGSGNTCGGDSGGPDLVRGTSMVVALTNQGTCSRDQDTRLETARGPRPFIDRAAGLTGARPTVRYGSRGVDVKVVQRLLGLRPGGTFGPRTRAAVVAWQREHHLRADGVVGYRTWHTLGF